MAFAITSRNAENIWFSRAVFLRDVHSSRLFAAAAILLCALVHAGCNTGSTSRPTTPAISVAIFPASANVFLGQSQTFQAAVTGTSNSVVNWEVNGIAGGNATLGEIATNGAYVAPGTMLSPATVTITAVTAADSTASASAVVTLKDDIVVNVSPGSESVPTGGEQVFSASVTASGNPAPGVAWSVNSIAGGNQTVGTIVPNGTNTAIYTAPAVQPTPAGLMLTATSLADNAKTGSASITVTCPATDAIAPLSAIVALGGLQAFTASFCLGQGSTIVWDVNGSAGGDPTDGTIVSTGATSALYTAPADLPANTAVTVHAAATAVTSGPDSASASITVTSGVSVSVAPPAAAVTIGQRVPLVANVSGSADTAVTWFVDGVASGNAIVGQLCLSGSSPCSPPTGPIPGAVDFLAPAQVPNPNAVMVKATSRADASQSGTAVVTISAPAGPVSVSIAPPYLFLPASSSQPDTQQFYAAVSGGANENVIWSLQSAVNGAGCVGSTCGSISSGGIYTAPTVAPSPNAIAITATSQADNTKSATAIVAVSSGPTIEAIAPSSVMAGAVEGFPLAVHGVNFIAGGSAASVILVNGVPRATTCATAGACAIAIEPSDIASSATLSIEVQNPGSPGAISNPVPFVIEPFDVSVETISLTSDAPTASQTDIAVMDPTTAASSSPIGVESVGMLTNGNNCGVQGSPLSVTRPASGTETVSICVFGNGLDPAFTYAFTGPANAPNASDIGVSGSAVNGLFAGMIELDLQISSATLPGVRTLVVTTINNDRAVGTGILEVK